METVLRCDCGYEVRADDEAELVARVRRHALGEHGMQLSHAEVLELASRSAGAPVRSTSTQPKGICDEEQLEI